MPAYRLFREEVRPSLVRVFYQAITFLRRLRPLSVGRWERPLPDSNNAIEARVIPEAPASAAMKEVLD
jgi:hypothetical protein